MNGIVVRADRVDGLLLGVASRRWRHWANQDMFVTRSVGIDPCQRAEHPFANRAKGIMRERIHRGILLPAKAFLFGVAVPAFPNRCRAVLDLEAPRWEFSSLQQRHRQ